MAGDSQPFDGFQKTHFRRNAVAFIGESTLFGLALLFASTTTILPGLVSQLSGSAVLVGLIITLTEGAWRLPQLLFANWVSHKPRKKPYLTRVGLAARPLYLVFALALWLGIGRHPSLCLALFFLLHTLMYTGFAVDTVVWWDVLAKAVPPQRRGRILGTSTVLRGAIAIAGGVLVSFLFGDSGPAFPSNYAISLAIAGALFMLSLGSWMLVAEPKEPTADARTPWPEYFREVGRILRTDSRMRRLLVVRILAGFDGFALGFYVLFGLKHIGLSSEMIGVFAAVQMVGGILSGILFGWVSERFGNHRVIQIATAASFASPLIALFFLFTEPAGIWRPLYAVVFAAIGISMNANFIGFANYSVDLAPPGKRSTYIGLFNTISGLVVVWPAIGGWVLQQTSYTFLFTVTLGMLVVAHLSSWWLRSMHGETTLKPGGMPPLP
ncbi:MFS transporter [Candidatus Bipolaricaulota bacterium]|nr:MFS transporter [Candidatus Bipolaricaulota bacterium]